jgi:hypothetical protein
LKLNKRSTQIRPDKGARRSARAAARLERAITVVEAELLKRDRTPWAKAPAISDMLKTLEALVRLEKLHLKLSVDPRPFIVLKQALRGRTLALRGQTVRRQLPQAVAIAAAILIPMGYSDQRSTVRL